MAWTWSGRNSCTIASRSPPPNRAAIWTSPATGAVYTSGWELAVPGEGLRVEAVPEVRGAENRSSLVPGLSYWEGPVRLTGPEGRQAGEGFVELTGYTKGGRLPL